MAARLIGLGGYAHSGKDAFADALAAQHGWCKTFMSKPLEEALLRVDPWVNINHDNWVDGAWPKVTLWKSGHLSTRFIRYRELHTIIGYADSKNNHDVRTYLQKLGTEVGRDMCDEDVWVRWVFREAHDLQAAGYDVAVTGIRFHNELSTLHARGGISVWVDRPGYGPVNEHSSDNTLGPDDFDVVVNNDGTLADLELAADRFHTDPVWKSPIAIAAEALA